VISVEVRYLRGIRPETKHNHVNVALSLGALFVVIRSWPENSAFSLRARFITSSIAATIGRTFSHQPVQLEPSSLRSLKPASCSVGATAQCLLKYPFIKIARKIIIYW